MHDKLVAAHDKLAEIRQDLLAREFFLPRLVEDKMNELQGMLYDLSEEAK